MVIPPPPINGIFLNKHPAPDSASSPPAETPSPNIGSPPFGASLPSDSAFSPQTENVIRSLCQP